MSCKYSICWWLATFVVLDPPGVAVVSLSLPALKLGQAEEGELLLPFAHLPHTHTHTHTHTGGGGQHSTRDGYNV